MFAFAETTREEATTVVETREWPGSNKNAVVFHEQVSTAKGDQEVSINGSSRQPMIGPCESSIHMRLVSLRHAASAYLERQVKTRPGS